MLGKLLLSEVRGPRDELEKRLAGADGPIWLKALKKFLRREEVWPRWPAVGEVFKLTLDGNAPENQPLAMLKSDGYDSPERWKHSGKKVGGIETKLFKLVSVGYQPNFESVLRELRKHGRIPGGQWREALKRKFLLPPGRFVGVADSSWVSPHGDAHFPCVRADGSSGFIWVIDDFDASWLWLIEVK